MLAVDVVPVGPLVESFAATSIMAVAVLPATAGKATNPTAASVAANAVPASIPVEATAAASSPTASAPITASAAPVFAAGAIAGVLGTNVGSTMGVLITGIVLLGSLSISEVLLRSLAKAVVAYKLNESVLNRIRL